MHRIGLYLITVGIVVSQTQTRGAVLHKNLLAMQPLHFEENRGQVSTRARFIARGPHYFLEIQAVENRLTWTKTGSKQTTSVRTRLVGGNRDARLEGQELLAAQTNYFLGASQTGWHPAVPNYGKVQASGIYPGIDNWGRNWLLRNIADVWGICRTLHHSAAVFWSCAGVLPRWIWFAGANGFSRMVAIESV